jgi:hypothetical protein
MAMGRRLTTAGAGAASLTQQMDYPDLVPWLDNVSDEYDELPVCDRDVPYDE